MSRFKRTEISRFPRPLSDHPEDKAYWGCLDPPVSVQEYGPITNIDISRVQPHLVAVTSYSKVQIYNPDTNDVYKNLNKFQDACYGGTFRHDGKLVAAGTSEGNVKMFDVNTKTVLRVFRGHDCATHRVGFTRDNTHLASFSDDKTVKVWDIPSETAVDTFDLHKDYVRAGCVSAVSDDILVSGSYDHTVRLWDRRAGGEGLVMDHGAPVESVLLLQGGGLLASTGGHHIKIWDLVGGGRMIATLSPHHKTVTCVGLTGGGRRLVSGSLDRQVKFTDLTTFQVVYSLPFPSPVLSVAVSPDDSLVAAGMPDGLVQFLRRKPDKPGIGRPGGENRENRRNKQHHRYLRFTQFTPAPGDMVVAADNRDVELRHDTLLRKFEYSRALDQVMKPYVQRTKPEYTYSLLYELMRREGLKTALAGRDEKSLLLIMNYVTRYITDNRFSKLLVVVADMLIDMYCLEHGMSSAIDKKFNDLNRRLEREVRYVEELLKLQGTVDLVLAASSAGEEGGGGRVEQEVARREEEQVTTKQSSCAKDDEQSLVVSVS